MGAWTYMLKCSDESFYVGLTRHADLHERLSQHSEGAPGTAYTSSRLPIRLVWSEWFDRIDDAIACERRIKGWSRAKKTALIDNDYETISRLASRSKQRETGAGSA